MAMSPGPDLSLGGDLDRVLNLLLHELRGPLAPLRSSLYILERAEPGSEQSTRMIGIMNRQIRRLTALMDDMTDATHLTRGTLVLQRSTIDLVDLVRATAEDYRSLFSDADFRWAVVVPDQPLLVFADSTRMGQVIGRLLHNATRFTPPGGEIALTVESVPTSESARISVRDTGAGLEAGLLSRVFDPFFRGDLARGHGGLGLGLSLVKGLVEMHGGSVQAASDGPGQGATFTIELPLGPVDCETTPSPAPRLRRRVLVIDDSQEATDRLRDILQVLGHFVETANDGRAGIAQALVFRPDVVFCDIGLPKMDGYAVARALREEAPLRNAMLVAMTTYTRPEDRRRATEAGFHEQLAKPLSVERLQEVLARAVLPLA
jgi:two-component system CheB/CheR fusion protein